MAARKRSSGGKRTPRVRDEDRGYEDLLQRVRAMQNKSIEVGIFESKGSELYPDATFLGKLAGSAVTVLDVAIWNEFGTDHIPERSFIRAWFDENAAKTKEAVRLMLIAVKQGKYTPEQALELIAQRFVAEIQKRMAEGIPPPNAPATIEMKGSDKPLIDTGQLRSSITYVVKDTRTGAVVTYDPNPEGSGD